MITEVTLRLHPLPEAVSAAVCSFESIQGAVETVIATIQLGVPVARIELLDEIQLDAVNRYSKTSYPVAPTLFFEFHSDSARHVADQAETVQALAAERGGRGFQWATHPEDRARLWQARHDALYAALALRPGSRGWTTDVCVPISRLAECVVETKQDNAGAAFPICLVGHAGDGNFHLIYVLDPANAAELEEARRLNERMVLRALAMGGTCSGEHGVGIGKMKFLEREHGAALDVMRTDQTRARPGQPDEPRQDGRDLRLGLHVAFERHLDPFADQVEHRADLLRIEPQQQLVVAGFNRHPQARPAREHAAFRNAAGRVERDAAGATRLHRSRDRRVFHGAVGERLHREAAVRIGRGHSSFRERQEHLDHAAAASADNRYRVKFAQHHRRVFDGRRRRGCRASAARSGDDRCTTAAARRRRHTIGSRHRRPGRRRRRSFGRARGDRVRDGRLDRFGRRHDRWRRWRDVGRRT